MSREILREKVPRMSTRGGDVVFSSPNNSSILLGRDRNGAVDSGHGATPGSGAVTIVVGRKSEDPSISDDAATVYLSARSDPDSYAGTDFQGNQKEKSSCIVRADCVRISCREDLKVDVGKASLTIKKDGTVVVEGDVKIGASAFERAILGDTFLKHYVTHVHPVATTPAGMVAGPMTPAPLPEGFLCSRLKLSS